MSVSETTLPIAPELRLTDRLLAAFIDIREGEGITALLLAGTLFLTLASYYVLKTVREAMILSEGGAAVKSYAAAAQALLLMLIIPCYGRFASRVKRATLLNAVSLFFISHLLIFYALARLGTHIGVAFFIWLGVFNVLVIAQFWAFANDIYESADGERLFPLIGIGSALGAWAGSTLVTRLFSVVGTNALLLIGAAGFLACLGLLHGAQSRLKRRPSREAPLERSGGFELILKNRYLLLIATMVIILNIVNSMGEFMLGKAIVINARQAIATGVAGNANLKDLIGRSYGEFFSWVNLLGLVIQLFAAPRIFRRWGVRLAIFILPLIALGSYGLISFLPFLSIVRFTKILENSTDYSIQNTARHALFLPTSREMKYKAQTAIDSFFWRLGDVFQAGIVLAAAQLAFPTQVLALINVGLVCLWLCVVLAISNQHRRVYGCL